MNQCPPKELRAKTADGKVCCKGCEWIGLSLDNGLSWFRCGYYNDFIKDRSVDSELH